jgi:tetratricopeptide (TPR) repeat protein
VRAPCVVGPWLVVVATVFSTVLSTAACSTRRAPEIGGAKADVVAPRDPRALMREGCFECLRAALDAARARGDAAGVFEAASLLALRAKELGMPPEPWLNAAGESQPAGTAWEVFSAIVAAIPADPLGGDRETLLTQSVPRRQILSALELWRSTLATPPGSDLFRAYLDLSLACPFGSAAEWTGTVTDTLRRLGEAPLLLYRVGFCGAEQDAARLRALRTQYPRFFEADYALGRLALQSAESPDEDEALRRFRAASAAFPTSSAILTSIGQVLESQEEWEEALAAHDAALALVPTHRDSLLGRTIALSNLTRREGAIESATRLIDLGNWFLGQAYYWRAWNHFHLSRYGPARADADRAKAAVHDPAVLVLSGMIEWRERRLESAEREFVEARRVDGAQCEAASFLGAVQAERGRFGDALTTFTEATACFDAVITERQAAIEKLDATGTRDARRRHRQSHERAIADATTRRDEAKNNEARLRLRLSPQPVERTAEP